MKSPNSAIQGDMKRLGRYLVAHRCLVSRFESQRLPNEVTVIVDSDHAGCLITRKSTSGIVCKFGRHVLKASSSLSSEHCRFEQWRERILFDCEGGRRRPLSPVD
eukprot:2757812-Pyramimonas_sp.AAC.1